MVSNAKRHIPKHPRLTSTVRDVLGKMYEEGRGVPQDYERAHMWFNLAALSGEYGIVDRHRIAQKMTPQQIAEAQKLARECQQRNFKGCDSVSILIDTDLHNGIFCGTDDVTRRAFRGGNTIVATEIKSRN